MLIDENIIQPKKTPRNSEGAVSIVAEASAVLQRKGAAAQETASSSHAFTTAGSCTLFTRTAMHLSQKFKKRFFSPSSSDDASLKESIRAFRTITTVLATIQQRSSIPTSDNLRPKSDPERHELSVLNALTTVLVRVNEVIAAVTSRQPGNEGPTIFACQQSKNEPTTTSSSLPQFLINMNPRKDTVVSNNLLALSDPSNPNALWDDLDPETPRKLIEYVRKGWWVLR